MFSQPMGHGLAGFLGTRQKLSTRLEVTSVTSIRVTDCFVESITHTEAIPATLVTPATQVTPATLDMRATRHSPQEQRTSTLRRCLDEQ